MDTIIDIYDLDKTYTNGAHALKNINCHIARGEIFALLGPNGAGKTTLINTICGLVRATHGTILVDGHDHIRAYRSARQCIGLVPQELLVDPFLTVEQTLRYQRGYYGKPYDALLIKQTLRDLSLWDKRDKKVHTLSGGMKRRVLIAKALMNEPKVLFLDEPTAGVDVELRRSMWRLVRTLQKKGTTIILTTHYLEEAEEMADRIGIITGGEITLTEEKAQLLKRFGKKSLTLTLSQPLQTIPRSLQQKNITHSLDGKTLTYTYATGNHTGITALLTTLKNENVGVTDITTTETSLEEIFVNLTSNDKNIS